MISKEGCIRCHASTHFENFMGGDFFNCTISEGNIEAYRIREERCRSIVGQL